MVALVVLLLFLTMVVLGFPIFAAMAIAGLAGDAFLGGTRLMFQNAALGLYQSFSSFELVAVPLYILVGTLMERAQLSAKLFMFARAWFGDMRGGLGVATIVSCALFAAISGSSVATAATIGIVALPLLTERGYDRAFSGAMIAAGGTLGILIPPSIAMIVFAVITEQSIGALFIAGVVPGVLLAATFAIYVSVFGPKVKEDGRTSLSERLAVTRSAAGALSLPVVILGAIYSGLATPTEVGAIAVAYVLVLGFTTRSLTMHGVSEATRVAARTTAMIFLLVGSGRILTDFFTLSEVPQNATNFVVSLELPTVVVVTLIIAVILVLGMFLESLSMILIVVPILYPIMLSLGFDPLAFGVFMVLAVEVALITPPVGINLFMLCSIGDINLVSMSRNAVAYVFFMIIFMYLILFFPQIATWLPATMK